MHTVVVSNSPPNNNIFDRLRKLSNSDLTVFKNIPSSVEFLSNSEFFIVFFIIDVIDESFIKEYELIKPYIFTSIILSDSIRQDLKMSLVDIGINKIYTKQVSDLTLEFDYLKISDQIKREDFIFYKSKNKLKKLRVKDLTYIETEGNYSYLFTEKNKIVLKKSLTKVLKDFRNPSIVQVFRNIAVNVDRLTKIDFTIDRIEIGDKIKLPIGNSFRQKLKQHIRNSFKVV